MVQWWGKSRWEQGKLAGQIGAIVQKFINKVEVDTLRWNYAREIVNNRWVIGVPLNRYYIMYYLLFYVCEGEFYIIVSRCFSAVYIMYWESRWISQSSLIFAYFDQVFSASWRSRLDGIWVFIFRLDFPQKSLEPYTVENSWDNEARCFSSIPAKKNTERNAPRIVRQRKPQLALLSHQFALEPDSKSLIIEKITLKKMSVTKEVLSSSRYQKPPQHYLVFASPSDKELL